MYYNVFMDTQTHIDCLLEYITEKRKEVFFNVLADRTKHIAVMLENIYQPHNASAVLRSCDAFGVQDVYVVEQQNNFNPNQEIAMGSAKWLSIKKTINPIETVYEKARNDGYKIIATSLQSDSYSLDAFDITQPSMLVFGNELQGLSHEATSLADETLNIRMFGFVESFNISVSVAIILSNIIPKLHDSNIDWKLSREEQQEILLEWLRKDIHRSNQIEQRYNQNQS